jgi:gamma-glutamyltranspeptidase/glutathione hydrolase
MGAPTPGRVAAGHAKSCEAATDLLRAGGNAFDAAVAAAFASAVVEPSLSSLGGGGFLLARPAAGDGIAYDFFADTPGRGLPESRREPHFLPVTVRFPGSEQVFNVGLGSAAVPGCLAGLLEVHEQLGALPLSEVVAPAIDFAREGVALNHHQAYFLELLTPIMRLTDEAARVFAPDGAPARAGELLRNPDLADYLSLLPQDRGRELYHGDLGGRVERDMREGEGLLTARDLAAYRVERRTPLAVDYRGFRLLTNPPPSFGGSLLALSLRLLEQVGDLGDVPAGPRHLGALASVMQEVLSLRERGCLDPRALDGLPAHEREAIAGRARRFSRGTTHVSVCDALGNAASLTLSNGEGSGYVIPGTGIMLNNMLGEDDLHPDGFHAAPPGERVASMMSPSLLLRDDELALVLGSGGSKRIRTALLQVVSLVVDFGMDLADAVEHPRAHWDGELLQLEPGFPADALATLAEALPLNVWDRKDVYFGGVHAVVPGAAAVGDSRRGGADAVVEGA